MTLCNWILDSLTDPKTVWIGSHASSPLTLEHPRAVCSASLLFTLYTHDCTLNIKRTIVKYAMGHVTNNDKSSYKEEINNLAEWCTESNVLLSVSKTKELIVDSVPFEFAQNITGLHLPSSQ